MEWFSFVTTVVVVTSLSGIVCGLEAYPSQLRYFQILVHVQDMVRRGEIIDNDIEDEFYLRRLDAGLFVLQHICYIMAEICNANVPQVGGLPRVGLSVPASLIATCLGRDSRRKKWLPLPLNSFTLTGPSFSGMGLR